MPDDETGWRELAADFLSKWHHPHCIGAIDGKHVQIKAPPRSGSQFYNYKGTFSTILLAVCDANYCITYVVIGSYGRMSDAGVFGSSGLAAALSSKSILIPEPEPLPNSEVLFPYVLVGDAAFPLSNYLMRPFALSDLNYSHRVYNYR